MSNRLFQSMVLQLKESTDRTIGVIDMEGTVIACTDLPSIGERMPVALPALNGERDAIIVVDGKTFKSLVGWSVQFGYAVFVQGEDQEAKLICNLAAVALNGIKSYYEEKYDKATFIKNIITDNIMLGDNVSFPGDLGLLIKEGEFGSNSLYDQCLVIKEEMIEWPIGFKEV